MINIWDTISNYTFVTTNNQRRRQNMRLNIYLRSCRLQLLFYPLKPWDAAYTNYLAGPRYLCTYLKPDAQQVSETWPVSGTFLPTQNMRPDVYIPAIGTCFPIQNMKRDVYLRHGRSLFPHPKYEARNVPAAGSVAGTFFPTKIWSRACTWGLAGCMYLFSHPKYEARHVPASGSYLSNKNMRRRGLAGRRYLFSHPKYEARHVPASITCLSNKNIRHRGLSGRWYLFSHQKYEARYVPASGP